MENIDERNDFYYDHRDIIHLTNQTELIINYPGGDRFGDLYAEPYTDISFHSFKLSGNNDLDDNLYLFLNDKYNEGNKILDYLNEFSSNANFSIEEIIIRLTTMNVNIPFSIFFVLGICNHALSSSSLQYSLTLSGRLSQISLN